MKIGKHKAVTDRVEELMKAIDGTLTVLVNVEVPEEIPDDGLIVVRDGTFDSIEETMGGFDTVYVTRTLEIEVIVQAGTAEDRDMRFDELMLAIGAALLKRDAAGNQSLGGLVYGVKLAVSDDHVIYVEGAAQIKVALIKPTVEYSAPSALG